MQKIVLSEYFWLALILLVAAFLRFNGLTFQGLWGDELTSVVSSSTDRSFGRIIAHYRTDPHPPLFFLVLHYWFYLFGFNEWSARLLVALIGISSVLAVYLLGKESYNKKAGLIAATIAAFNYFNLYYSQEVRPYILLFLAAALSYTFFLRLIKEQTRKNVIYYSLSSVLLIYSHYFGLFILLSQGIFLLYYLLSEKETPRLELLKYFSVSGVIILVLYSPWIPTLLRMMGRKHHWIAKPPAPDFFITYFHRFFGDEPFLVMVFAALIFLLLLHFMGLKREGASPAGQLDLAVPVLFSWAFFSLFIPYYRSLTTVPMLVPHYAIGTLPALIVMAAVSIALFKHRTFKILLVSAIILVSAVNIYYHKGYYKTVTKAQWREAAELAIRDMEGKEGIYVMARAYMKYQFYFDSLDSNKKVFPALKPSLKKIASYKNVRGIWLLEGARGKKNVKRFLKWMQADYRLLKEKAFKGGIKAGFWVPKSGDSD
jgi:uncharacterized membrane protein